MWRHPLVLAAGLWVAGMAAGRAVEVPAAAAIGLAVAAWGAWLLADVARWRRAGAWMAVALFFAGAAVWRVDQSAVETVHVARFASEAERPVTARVRVVVPPMNAGRAGAIWVGWTEGLLSDRGWVEAAGWVRVKTRAGIEVRRGDLIEVHGWLRRPSGPENPGAMDVRAVLAADRVFAEVRVPREVGTIFLERGAGGESWLARGRAFLRGKLLEHTAREDVEAGYAMEALLLGVREPVIDEVTRAFSDAGVAHLLAISGAHVVFVAGVVWALLRMVPMRPRWREVVVAAAVLAYVLATPCGPPVVRAAVAVVMVVMARLLGRPAVTLNTLAAAAIVVLLWRPADVLDAGFQLSFVGTAGLIVFAERVYGAVFAAWIEREKAIAGLAGTWWARMQVRVIRAVCALLVANGIGVATTMPLVALHFGKVNPLGVFTGMAALPVVALAMVASALQVGVEVVSSVAGAWVAPVTALAGRLMVWVVEHLAMVPGSAVSVRAPAWGVVICVYVVWVVWAVRRRVGVSRAMVVNLAAGAMVVVAGWYALMMPRGELRVEVLRVGIGSAMVVRMPDGAVWVVDAGSREVMTPMERAVGPALRVEGVRRIAGMVVMGLDEVHARDAASVIAEYRPGAVVVSKAAWRAGEFTRAGGAVQELVAKPTLMAEGDAIVVGGAKLVWMAEGMMAWEFSGRRVVVVDGKSVGALSRFVEGEEVCDAVVVTGAEGKGMGDLLERVHAPIVRAGNVVRVGEFGLRIERF